MPSFVSDKKFRWGSFKQYMYLSWTFVVLVVIYVFCMAVYRSVCPFHNEGQYGTTGKGPMTRKTFMRALQLYKIMGVKGHLIKKQCLDSAKESMQSQCSGEAILGHWYRTEILISKKQAKIMIDELVNHDCEQNFLVFGTGYDSPMWEAANYKGLTTFVEDIPAWAVRVFPWLTCSPILLAKYKTEAKEYKSQMYQTEWLLEDLPGLLRDTKGMWDMVLVDGPIGKAHGRVQSMVWAKYLVKPDGKIYVHDVNRVAENETSQYFFGTKLKKDIHDRGTSLRVISYGNGH